MAGTEELMSRLQQLEDSYYGDKESARQKAFFDQYGSQFSNDEGIGLAILNELNARGIDTSAADEAVYSILDQLRTEANAIVNAIKIVQREAQDMTDKVNEIGDVVSTAIADNPNGELPFEANPEAGDMPMPEAGPGDIPVPEAGPGDMPVPEAGPGDIPVPEAGDMPMPEAGPGDEEFTPPPGNVISDARLKRIKGVYGDKKVKRNSWKPSSGIISAAQRGF